MTNSLGFPITSIGYAGTIAANDVWASLQATLGARYTVADPAAGRVTPLGSGTRQVNVAAGTIGGRGVLDQITSDFTVQLPTVASGTRWFMVVARRTWGVTQATSVTSIDAGTSNSTIPARNTNPGTVDDQPLALVPLTAGNTVPGTPIDLRVIGTAKGGIVTGFNQLALSYFDEIGAQVRIGTDTWTRVVNGSYVASWAKDPGPYGRLSLTTATGTGLISLASGWALLSTSRGTTDGNETDVFLELTRTGSAIGVDPNNGNLIDQTVGTVSTAYRPLRKLAQSGLYAGNPDITKPPGINGAALLQLGADGTLTLSAGAPGINLTKAATGTVSLSVHFNFSREDATDISASF